jgi:hypothetical protein
VCGLQTGILRGKNLHSMGRDILNSNGVNGGRPCNNYESRKGDFFAGVFPPFFKRMDVICRGLHLFRSLVLALRTTFTFLINYKTDNRIVNLVVSFAGTKKRSERALFVEVEVSYSGISEGKLLWREARVLKSWAFTSVRSPNDHLV